MTDIQPPRSRALVITGGLGSGKTSVAIEMASALDVSDLAYALVDLDFLCWAKPADDCILSIHDLLVLNLIPVVRGFQSVGVDHFILPRFILTRLEAGQLRQALNDCGIEDVRFVELEVGPETARARLAHRDHGSTLAEHLESVDTLTAEDGIADAPFSTDQSSIADVSAQLLEYWLS